MYNIRSGFSHHLVQIDPVDLKLEQYLCTQVTGDPDFSTYFIVFSQTCFVSDRVGH